MRKRGMVLDMALNAAGVSQDRIEEFQFIKTAMIDRVMFNLDQHHIKKTGSPLFSDDKYEEIVNKTAENIAISDIAVLPDISSKVGFIIQEIGRNL